MAKYSQSGRMLALKTPLGDDALLLETIQGTESISAPFQFQLGLLAESATPIAFDTLLGELATVSITLPDGSIRPINGVIVRLSQGGQVQGVDGRTTFIRYRAEIVPKFWLLTRTVRSQTFQQLSVPDILKQVLTGVDLVDQTQGEFKPRDYCVQYQESDFAFASRLMEEEGIYYFFKHTASGHQMVLANTPQSHPDVPGDTSANYEIVQGGVTPEDRILSWEKTQEIRSGKYTLWDACFELPGQNLQASQPILETVQAGTITHKLKVGGNSAYEVYEYPGGYAQRFDGIGPGGAARAADVNNIFTDNARTATIRMQQEALPSLVVAGTSTCRQLASGCKFTLDRHFDANGSYILTKVAHQATLGAAYVPGSGDASYTNQFDCIPAALPFRPKRVAPRPRIDGPQTAVVVGPSGQEIFTDKYGRVKVQFPWDRLGKKDANSSCWIRVGSSWAGKQWGFAQIPRIGQEVIVAFEDGDPDRPIITGSVYNAEMMPPFTLPDEATQSGTKSRSSAQGEAAHSNQFFIEDKKGSELITLHAEKDFTRIVENDDSLTVGVDGSSSLKDGNQTITIYKNRTTSIETGNETLTVKKGKRTVEIQTDDESLKVTKGNRAVEVTEGNDTHTVKGGNRSVEVTKGNDTLSIKAGTQATDAAKSITLKVGGSTIEIKPQEITLTVGANTIAMKPAGITLTVGASTVELAQQGVTTKGMNVKAEATLQAEIKGLMSQIGGDAMLTLKGGVTMIN